MCESSAQPDSRKEDDFTAEASVSVPAASTSQPWKNICWDDLPRKISKMQTYKLIAPLTLVKMFTEDTETLLSEGYQASRSIAEHLHEHPVGHGVAQSIISVRRPKGDAQIVLKHPDCEDYELVSDPDVDGTDLTVRMREGGNCDFFIIRETESYSASYTVWPVRICCTRQRSLTPFSRLGLSESFPGSTTTYALSSRNATQSVTGETPEPTYGTAWLRPYAAQGPLTLEEKDNFVRNMRELRVASAESEGGRFTFESRFGPHSKALS